MRTMSNYKEGEKSDESTSDVDVSFSCKTCRKSFKSRQELKEIPIELHKRKDKYFLLKLSHISLVSLKIANFTCAELLYDMIDYHFANSRTLYDFN